MVRLIILKHLSLKKKHTYIPKKADGTQDVFNNANTDSKQNHNVKKNGKNRRRNKNKAKEITDEEWEIFRTFEKTTIKQKDNNFDIQLDEIRVSLNKASPSSFDATYDDINLKIEMVEENKEVFLIKVLEIIFELSSCNDFNQEVYAKIITKMIDDYNE